MLRYSLNQAEMASVVEKAVKNVIDVSGVRTKDISGQTTTDQAGDAVCAEIRTLLQA